MGELAGRVPPPWQTSKDLFNADDFILYLLRWVALKIVIFMQHCVILMDISDLRNLHEWICTRWEPINS